MEDTPLVMIESAESLQELVRLLEGEPVIGVDTEADSMHHYREKVCLIQLSDRHRDYIVDPLAGFSLEPLAAIFANPRILKIFHGADYDVVSLKRDFDFEIRGIFDTMIAAQLLEFPRVGLADLCKKYFAAHMDKRYQTHDWSQRPLLPEHLDYARGDTHYLLALTELLTLKLKRVGRLEVAREEFALLEDRVWQGPMDDEGQFLRVKGLNKADERDLPVVRALWEMRDRHARRLDRPPYKVIPDPVLLKLARSRPTNHQQLSEHVRSRSSMVRRFGDDMLKAVADGLVDDRPIPDPPRKKAKGTRPRAGARDAERLFGELKNWRAQVMKRDGVPMVMVANNGQLKALAGFQPRTDDELRGLAEIRDWQADLYGTELLEVVNRYAEANPARSQPSSKRRRRRRGSGDAAE